MALLIDGYNLLNVTGLFGHGRGPATLERSRYALLHFLAEAIDPGEREYTTIVFDAKNAPPGLPWTIKYQGLTVKFAAEYEDADDLIEELIRADAAPRRLTVVSSDHRLQRAARRRKAIAIDSEVWYAEVVRQRRAGERSSAPADAKPRAPLSEEEVQWWLKQFGEFSLEDLQAETTFDAVTESSSTDDESTPPADIAKPSDTGYEDIANPFPPGYGEDLLSDEEP